MCTTRRLGGADDLARGATPSAALTSAAPPPQRLDLEDDCWLQWWPELPWCDSVALGRALRDELPLSSEALRIHGREIAVPRLVSYHGAPGTAYRYSGRTHEPLPWTPLLLATKQVIDDLLGLPSNAVLANCYRDGRDSMGYHADDEPELGPSRDDIVIASLSFGAQRRFLLKHRSKGTLHRFELGGGCLFVMRGRTQEHYRHAVPRTRGPVGPRLNLTFRTIVPGAVAEET